MRAVVLVGGEGTRLRPLTFSTPKQMLPVAEVPMIERVLGLLSAHGIDDAILSMGYRPEAFLDAWPEGVCAGVHLTYAVEPEPLDTAGGILFAARAGGVDDTFLVVNGDVLSDVDLSALVQFHRDSGAEATISLTPVDDPSAFGVVPTDGTGRVTGFIEKPAREEAPTNLINAGYYVVEPRFLDRIPEGVPVHVETETFPLLIEDRSLYALRSDAYWTDTGTPQLFLRATFDLIDGHREGPPSPGARQREDGVWVQGSPVVDGVVTGPALVGDAAFIGGDAHVSRSVVGVGARLEGDARVVDSIVLAGAVVRAGAHVEGSIVGETAVVGEGAHLCGLTVVQGGAEVPAGARLDGDRVVAA